MNKLNIASRNNLNIKVILLQRDVMKIDLSSRAEQEQLEPLEG